MSIRTQRIVPVMVLFALVALGIPSLASGAAVAHGHWEGTIDIPARPIEVRVDLVLEDDSWRGDIEIPSQNPSPIPLDAIAVTGRSVSFGVTKVPGKPRFEGRVSDDGKLLTGIFFQGGGDAKFRLRLVEGVRPAAEPFDPFVYTVDPAHTSIGFSVSHFTVSRVRGRFGEVSGRVRFDPDELEASSVEITIHAASVDTGHEQRDAHLRGPDFLDVDAYPLLTFRSSAVTKTEHGLTLLGALTLRGVTRTVEIPFEMAGPIADPLGMTRIGATGELTLDRRDYGIDWNKSMEAGGLFVGHDVRIELSLEATRF